MISFNQCLKFVVVLAALALVPRQCFTADKSAASTGNAEQQKLIGVLAGGAAPAEKAAACKRLAMIGNEQAVPEIAALLPDEHLSSWARIALEVSPGPAADEALRAAAGQLQGRLLVGVINSLGVRRDKGEVQLLVARLKDTDSDVAAAAAVALGHIDGGRTVVAALRQSLATGPQELRAAAGEGLVLCAEHRMASGMAGEAAGIYDEVRTADVPLQRVLDATRGAILSRGAAGVPLLIEQLRSTDKQHFNLGLVVAREMPGHEFTQAIAAEASHAAPQRQALLILALADRDDPGVAPLVVNAARSGPDAVRTQALLALSRFDETVTASVLLDAALEPNAAISKAAMETIDELRGQTINRLIADRLPRAESHAKLTLIELAGRRQVAAATPILWQLSESGAELAVRAAALKALGGTVSAEDLPRLIARLGTAKADEESAAILEAITDALPRMPDREACAAKIAAAMPGHSLAIQCQLLEVLKSLGGAKALSIVASAAHDRNAQLRDTGFKLLGQWMSTDAAPVLLELVQNSKADDYKVRALRAYIRLARQFDMPDAQRVEMCRTAMTLAQRADEKRLVLEIALRYPSEQMLALAEEATKVPELKEEAALVAMGISRARGSDTKELRKVLAQAGHQTVKLEIVRAEYGEGRQVKDVTNSLRKYAGNYRVIFLPSANYNAAFGGDPAPNRVKQLKVNYRINGLPGEVTLNENATVVLPIPK